MFGLIDRLFASRLRPQNNRPFAVPVFYMVQRTLQSSVAFAVMGIEHVGDDWKGGQSPFLFA